MISIILPLFNKEQWVVSCIRSILNQSLNTFELIIVNDGSTDKSLDLVKENFADERIRIVTQTNKGVSAARNAGICLARFDYIAFIDADDLWHPEYLSICQKIIGVHSHIDIFGSGYTYMQDAMQLSWPEIGKLDFYEVHSYFKNAHKAPLFWTSATIVKKEIFDKVGLFNTALKAGEDLDLWFRIMLKGKGLKINNLLACYRLTGSDQKNIFKLPNIHNHLVSKILNESYFYKKEIATTPFLGQFISYYTLNYLFLYYFDSNQYKEAWKIYLSIPLKYKLSKVRYLLYWLPRRWGRAIFLSIFFKRNKYNVDSLSQGL